MKKVASILTVAVLLSALFGCAGGESSSSDIPAVTAATSATVATAPTTAGDTAAKKTKTTKKKKTTTTKKVTTTAPPIKFKSRLPEVSYAYRDNGRYRDLLRLESGFAVAGHYCTHDNEFSMIRIFNDSTTDYDEYLFPDGNGFEQIAACRDGGFVMTSWSPPAATKVNSDLEREWFEYYEDPALEGWISDVKELSNGNIAVLFASVYTEEGRGKYRWRLTILDPSGELLNKFDLMEHGDIDDAEIIPDNDGGFYLIGSCNEEFATEMEMSKDAYDPAKMTEAAVMHFSDDFRLTWVKTFGGAGNDWVEESTMDSDGNFYLAIGTNCEKEDSFWSTREDDVLPTRYPYRRMLVKLDRDGKIIYKLHLASRGMAVDQVFGIDVRDGYAYVVGMSDYFDGYQNKYPCEQIESDGAPRVMSVYTVCVNGEGKELYRNIFRCDENTTPADSVLLNDGTLVIAGSVSNFDNPFHLVLPDGINVPALFVYAGK